MHTPWRRAALCTATVAALSIGLSPSAASAGTAAGHSLAPNTRFYVPPPSTGAVKQIAGLLASDQSRNAGAAEQDGDATVGRVARWRDPGAGRQWRAGSGAGRISTSRARSTRRCSDPARQHAVPVFVAYNIPGRDCSQYSAGGAPSDSAYDAWINSIETALGDAKAVLILEPDALANLPGYCGSAYNAAFPNITNVTRIDDVAYGVQTLENDPNISLYLDAGHSAWQAVGNIAEVLTAADVQQAQGFFLNVSNYQYATNNALYGTWVSSCIAYATQLSGETQASALGYASTLSSADNNPSGAFNSCPNQYWNGGPANNWTGTAMSPYGVWSETQSDPTLNASGDRLALRIDAGQHGADHPLRGGHQPRRPGAERHAGLRRRAR